MYFLWVQMEDRVFVKNFGAAIEGNMHTVTVLMSSYNGEKYIAKQIDSILNQRNCKVNLIVRDDGSSDNTCEILEQYQKNKLLTWYSDGENLRPAHSFLRLLANAPDDDYYAFADQDDYWMPDKLKRAVKAIEARKDIPIIYYANSELVDSDLNSLHMNVYDGPQYPSLLMTLCSSNIMGCNMVFNKRMRDLFLKRTVENLEIGMHDYFIAQLCNACGGEIVYDDSVVMKYRQHDRNVVGYQGIKKQPMVKRIISKVLKKHRISIEHDAKNLLLYEEHIMAENLILVRKVSRYRESVFIRIELCYRLIYMYFTKKATKTVILGAARIFLGIA